MEIGVERRVALYWVLAEIVFAAPSYATYQVNCGNGGPFQVTQIGSVFAEARPACVGGCSLAPPTNARFHDGTDIGNLCAQDAPVRAIEDGIMKAASNCVTKDCFRVVSNDGTHAFDYVHISTSSFPLGFVLAPTGTPVSAGQIIGFVNFRNHLHLNDVDLSVSPAVKRNPETSGYKGSLDFSDRSTPGFPEELELGSASGDIIPVFFTQPGGEDGVNPSMAPLPSVGGTYLAGEVAPTISLIVTASGDLSARKGLHGMEVNVTPTADPTNFLYSGDSNIQFDWLLDSDDRSGIHTIYYQRNAASDSYFGTNSGTPCHQPLGCAGQAGTNDIDVSALPVGDYEACVDVYALSNSAGDEASDRDCITFRIPPPPPRLISLGDFDFYQGFSGVATSAEIALGNEADARAPLEEYIKRYGGRAEKQGVNP